MTKNPILAIILVLASVVFPNERSSILFSSVCSDIKSLMSLLQVHWSDSGELCAIATDDTIYILKYSSDNVTKAMENKDEISEDGIEEAFDV